MIEDMLLLVIDKLSDKDKIKFLQISKIMNMYKHKILFHDEISCVKIQNLSYYDNFTNVIFIEGCVLPKKIERVVIGLDFLSNINNNNNDKIYISAPIVCYTIDCLFALKIILSSVTFLSIRTNFYCDIPNTVTHLSVKIWVGSNSGFDNNINIPNSVIFLHINKIMLLIPKILPETLVHISFGKKINLPLQNDIPNTIKKLTLPSTYNGIIPEHCKVKYVNY